MGVRSDLRLDAAPMSPVTCGTCGLRVLARKSSWDQTSVQWPSAPDACGERRDTTPRPGPNSEVFLGCPYLAESIREAAVRGDLPVIDPSGYIPHPEAPAAGGDS